MTDRVSSLGGRQVPPARASSWTDHNVLDRNVLDSMSDGVLTVGADGRVGVFNPAASRMLGLAGADVRDRPFAQTIPNVEGLDEFSDAVLAAIYDGAVDARSTVTLRFDDGTERSLAVTVSYLTGSESGEARRVGIVAVFSDVTEIESLRKAERELTESMREQNLELRDAYREIEDRNHALDSALKKVTAVRALAMVLVALLFAGAAWYVWNETGTALVDEIGGASTSPALGEGATVTATVAPRPLKTTLSFVGRLAPREEVRVTSPVAGKVGRVRFEYGGRVSAGEPLVELDTADTARKFRSARAEHLEARDGLRKLENWKNSPEVARARRSVAQARLELEARRNRLSETALLRERGIIPASEHEAALRQHEAQRLSYEAAVQDLAAVQARADADAVQIARLKLENATTRMQELESTLRNAVIHAPVSGVVLQPQGAGQGEGQGSDAEPLAPGQSVSEGGYLLTVGDLDGLSVAGEIDEVDVVKLRPGQRVAISGDAFPDLELDGKIERISSQSRRTGSNDVPMFEVAAAIDSVSDAARQRLRLGMSANVTVVLRDEPSALLVPLAAVRGTQGGYWVNVSTGQDGAVRRVPVQLGATTLNEVEIVSGLGAGDEVVVSGM